MKVLIDTNIIMDALTEREPFAEKSKQVIKICSEKNVDGFLAAHTITNLFYLLRHDFSVHERREILISLFDIFSVEQIDEKKLLSALKESNFPDFEDCLQVECAKAVNADYIITRNKKDFSGKEIPSIDPDAFCAMFYS